MTLLLALLFAFNMQMQAKDNWTLVSSTAELKNSPLLDSKDFNFHPLFAFSGELLNKPAWMDGTANRGLATFGDKVYAHHLTGNKIHVLNSQTGEFINTITLTGLVGGLQTLGFADIEVDEEGEIIICNLASDGGATPQEFRVYKVTESAATLILSFPIPAGDGRVGDKITVRGKLSDKSAVIYAVDAKAGKTRIFKFSMLAEPTTNILFDEPEVITLGTATGGSAKVAPIPGGGFYYTGGGVGVSKLNADGSLVGTISTATIAVASTSLEYIAKDGNDDIIAVYHWGVGGERVRIARVVNGDPATVTMIYDSPSMQPAGPNTNANGTGDVAILNKGEGVYNAYVMGTNVGISGVTNEVIIIPTYNVSFDIQDILGNPLADATVTFNGVTNNPGVYLFEEIEAGTYDYSVTSAGYISASGSATVVDEDITVVVQLEEVGPGFALLYDQPYFDGGSAITSAFDVNNIDYEVAENFSGLQDEIGKVVFYGLAMKHNGTAWVQMTPDATEPFILKFYEYQEAFIPGLYAPATGTHKLALIDDYGDGWNGGKVTVLVNGTAVLTDITLASGAGPAYHEFEATLGDEISTVYTAGSWPVENYYAILDPSENIIAEQGGSWADPGGSIPGNINPGFEGPLEPTWATPVSTQLVDVEVDSLGLIWSGQRTLYKFTANLTTPVDLENGWVSAQIDAVNGSGTWFLWLNSQFGDGQSWQRVPPPPAPGKFNRETGNPAGISMNAEKGGAKAQVNYDLAIELWGGVLDVPLCVNYISPVHGAVNVPKKVTLKWYPSPVATGYTLFHGTTLPATGIDLGDTTQVTLTLNYNTTYQWKIVPYNEVGNAVDCDVYSFTTLPDPTLIPPFVQDFSSETFPPLNWSRHEGILAETTVLTPSTGGWFKHNFGNTGTNPAAYINMYGTKKHWLVTPPINLGTNDLQYKLTFDIALTPYTGIAQSTLGPDDYIAVVISFDEGETWSDANVLIDWDATDVISPTGDPITVSLAEYTGVVMLAFYAERPTGNDPDLRFYVDNVSVVSGLEPVDPLAMNVLFDKTGANKPPQIGDAGNARAAALYQNRYVVVPSREGGANVWVWDMLSPSQEPMALNMGDGLIVGGLFLVNYVEVVGDDIYVSNMSLGSNADHPFRVYRWSGLDAEPELVLSANGGFGRLGDAFNIHGNPAENGSIIAHVNSGGGGQRIFRKWNFVNGEVVNLDNPETITLNGTFNMNSFGVINPIEGETELYLATGNGMGIAIINMTGEVLAYVDNTIFPSRTMDPHIFYYEGKRYLSYVVNNEGNTVSGAYYQVLDITEGETVVEALSMITSIAILETRIAHQFLIGGGAAFLSGTNRVYHEGDEIMILSHVVAKGFILETTGALPSSHTLTVVANPSDAGTVTGTGDYFEGAAVPVTATPADDYQFVNWTVGTEIVSTQASFSFTMPGAATTLVANFEPIPITEVPTLAELRTKPADGTLYKYTGNAVIVAMNEFRNRKFIQDETAAILIDDEPGIITTDYELYDVITNIVGKISISFNMVRFQPQENTAASSVNTPVEPTAFAINEIASADQSKLIKLSDVTFVGVNAGDVFAYATNYTISDGTNEMVLRTDFINVNYIGQAIPTTELNITGVVIQFQDVMQIVPRFSNDFEVLGQQYTLTLVANPAQGGTVSGAGSYDVGEQVQIVATPADNFIFVKWTDAGGATLSTQATYTYTMPAADVTLTAVFELEDAVSHHELTAINVFPNPAGSNFTVTSGSLIKGITMFDITGKVVFKDMPNNTEVHISETFENGMYLLQIVTEQGVSVRKLQIRK